MLPVSPIKIFARLTNNRQLNKRKAARAPSRTTNSRADTLSPPNQATAAKAEKLANIIEPSRASIPSIMLTEFIAPTLQTVVRTAPENALRNTVIRSHRANQTFNARSGHSEEAGGSRVSRTAG